MILHAPLVMIALLFAISLPAVPMGGLSSAPVEIAERAADGVVTVDAGAAAITRIAFAD